MHIQNNILVAKEDSNGATADVNVFVHREEQSRSTSKHKLMQSTFTERERICFNCKGHWIYECEWYPCSTAHKNMPSVQEIWSFYFSLQGKPRHCTQISGMELRLRLWWPGFCNTAKALEVIVYLNDHSIELIVDTGATANINSQETHPKKSNLERPNAKSACLWIESWAAIARQIHCSIIIQGCQATRHWIGHKHAELVLAMFQVSWSPKTCIYCVYNLVPSEPSRWLSQVAWRTTEASRNRSEDTYCQVCFATNTNADAHPIQRPRCSHNRGWTTQGLDVSEKAIGPSAWASQTTVASNPTHRVFECASPFDVSLHVRSAFTLEIPYDFPRWLSGIIIWLA